MRHIDVSLAELAYVAATRGMLGAGVGLLASNFLRPETRKTVGLTLVSLGALSTLPIAIKVLRHREPPLLAD